MSIEKIKVADKVYFFEGISPQEAEELRKTVLIDPVLPPSQDPSEEIMIGYKPGVTDPIELSLAKAANLIGVIPTATKSAYIYESAKAPAPSQIQEIMSKMPNTFTVTDTPEPVKIIDIRKLGIENLEALSKARSLFLNNEEMVVIQKKYQEIGRDPTDLELEMLAQTWSEHCSHKTFKAILIDENGNEKDPMIDRIKKTSEKYFERVGVVTAFKDNAGGIRFYDGQVIIGKGETHNSPVAIEPYAGSLTKNGGLYRDIAGTGLGGENLMVFVINNFSNPDNPHSKYLLLGNSKGEREYGNPMGIPTHAINLHFHPDFKQKPTSLGVVVGIIPENKAEKGKPQREDLIIAVGGKTGRDGIHGATFSSGEMTNKTSTVHATAVQLGDPIIEKTMFEALLKCRNADLIRAITDCGAGGFSSAVGEMAQGIGAVIDLSKISTKYSGLAPWEKWLSESQERMIVAVDPQNWEMFEKICKTYDTNAEILGNFTGNNELVIYDNGEEVGNIDLDFLHEGLPKRRMNMKYSPFPKDFNEPPPPNDYGNQIKKVLSHLNICSKEEMHRMYDQTVQAKTILAPFTGVYQDAPSDGSIIAPFSDKPYGIVVSSAINPILNRINPYQGSIWAFAAAASRYIAIGGNINEAAGIDNFITPFPDEESLADIDKMTDGLCDMINLLQVPMVSGKDSLSSTYRSSDGEVIKVPPSLNITIFGKIPDIEKTQSADFKEIGSTICLVGNLDVNNMGGSVYFDSQGIVNSQLPKVDTKDLPRILGAVHDAIASEKIKSAKAVGEGGIAAALSLMCFGGDCGADININGICADRNDYAIFNETAGCILVEVKNAQTADDLFKNVPHTILGTTTKDKFLEFSENDGKFLSVHIDDLKKSWQEPMKGIING